MTTPYAVLPTLAVMAATETRLLLLGAVLLFEPVNGYQVRRELLSWGVEDWGHINPGSIYSGFTTLTKQGHLERHDLEEGARTVAVYTSTPSGRAEFDRLLAVSLETVDLTAPLPFHTAVSLLPLTGRATFRKHLEVRLTRLADRLATTQAVLEHPEVAPPHLPWLVDYWVRTAQVERSWVEGLVAEIDRGGLVFAGEPTDWVPPQDDPGWQMNDDRRRYRAALGTD